jgi:hypothetical protein
MKDTEREIIISEWYDIAELNKFYEECTKEEFINRVFKSRVDCIIIEDQDIVIESLCIYKDQSLKLFELITRIGKNIEINAGKGEDGYPTMWIRISDK